MAKLSVIIPVYNVENYIERCLKSLIAQTIDDFEFIIVNDGSTDRSKEIINIYLKKYPNMFKYFEKENGGLSSARNYGMKYATGEYIAFLDSDDYIEKDMYKIMYDKAKIDDADMVECDFIWEYYDNQDRLVKIKKDKRRKYEGKSQYIKRPRVVAWNKIIKRDIIKENKIEFPEGLIYEDIEFFYKLIPYVKKIFYVEKYFVHYVQREKSLSNVQSEKVKDIFEILDNVIVYYQQIGLFEKYEKELKYMYRRILLGSSMKRILQIKDRKLKKYLIKKTNEKIRNISKKTLNKKIIFGITKLDIGGAERVLVDISNKLCEKYDITILTIYSKGKLEKELNDKIKVVNLYNKQNKILPIYILLFGKYIYNKYIKNKYEIEIAFLEGPITRIFSNNVTQRKKIAWVHNDIKRVFGKGIKSKIKNFIDKNIYEKYDEIIFVSEDNKKTFNKLYKSKSKQKVIYNYIDKKRIIEKSKNDKNLYEKNEFPKILTVARLVKQKGIDRFIRVHKRLIDDGFKHNIYVIGDGEEKENLKNLIFQEKVEDSFFLLGGKDNPYPYIKNCDYFALLSYYEGYGMVIEEAKILGKPIIITKTASIEAVKDYEKSLVIPNNEEDIYKYLRNLLQGEYYYLHEDVSDVDENGVLINRIEEMFKY